MTVVDQRKTPADTREPWYNNTILFSVDVSGQNKPKRPTNETRSASVFR